MGCLYQLTSPSGKSYIGISCRTAEIRFARHVAHVSQGRRNAIHNAIVKYGQSSFQIKTLVIADDMRYLRGLERRAVQAFGTLHPNGYNLTGGGEHSAFWSKDSFAKVSAGQKRSWKANYEKRRTASLIAITAMQKACSDPAVESMRRERISQTMRSRSIGVGENNAASKLTADNASEIKRLISDGMTLEKISNMFGVSRGLIGLIKAGKRWAHV